MIKETIQQQQSQQATQIKNATASISSMKPQELPKELLKKQSVSMQLEQSSPVLRFTPTAWAKLLYFRDRGQTEIGGFGVSAADDLLLLEDFITIKQDATMASISFDNESVADFFDHQVDAGRKPEQFARVWLHSHPGDSPNPSSTDEETFARVFGCCQWAVMFIVAHGGKSYARLRFSVGPGGQVVIPVEVDYSQQFGQSDQESWESEYQANIKAGKWNSYFGSHDDISLVEEISNYSCPEEWLEELEATACDSASREHYPTTLFAAGDAYAGTCTAKTTIYCANIAAGFMLAQFTKHLRNFPVDADIQLNLLTSEITVSP
jgi:proteasome lid subunit RPN8/RPN11